MSHKEAHDAALRAFGNVTRAQERFYESRRVMWLDDLQRDVRFAVRALFKSRRFTAVAVLALAVGIGSNTAIFSLVNTLMLRSLPVRQPEQLVEMVFKYPGDPRLNLYMVTRRINEIGIRMALGATSRNVIGMVLAGALGLVGTGLVIGVPIALWAKGYVSRVLATSRPLRPGGPSRCPWTSRSPSSSPQSRCLRWHLSRRTCLSAARRQSIRWSRSAASSHGSVTNSRQVSTQHRTGRAASARRQDAFRR